MRKEIKRKIINRLKRIEGQVRGLQRMVGKDAYCIDVIHQSFAVKEALSSVENLLLKNHLSTHVIEQIKGGKEAKSIKEILAIYKLSRKK